VLEGIQSRELRFPREAKVVYHDPCQLARYLGLTQEPRQILKAIKGIELVEPEWTYGEWATCCGGGGGFEVVFPELSQILAVNRAKELVETGADIIVTHCPGCIMQLEEGLKALKIKEVKVLDLAQVVAMAMGV
jgi:heterodisulfide reductase subunit D